jgi:hypothetical protein
MKLKNFFKIFLDPFHKCQVTHGFYVILSSVQDLFPLGLLQYVSKKLIDILPGKMIFFCKDNEE